MSGEVVVTVPLAEAQDGDPVRVWLPDPAFPTGGSYWHGIVTEDHDFTDGAIGVRLQGAGGVVAKLPPAAVFPL